MTPLPLPVTRSLGRRAALVALGAGALGVSVWAWLRRSLPPSAALPAVEVAWLFEAPEPGAVVAAPVADEEFVYLTAAHWK